ncbi:MAG TPA: protein kinase [Pyrinomonadaceae bacterium]|jgi:serine/threonine protein kinase
MPLTTGTQLGRYEICSLLGMGGMGEVYLAYDSRLKRKIALKVLPDSFIDSREHLRRFEQEARAVSALNHPNIITIHEIGTDGDTHFIATELIEGETLRQKLRTGRLEIEQILDIVIQIASALNAAHGSGIVHRDLKPENIMLREDGLVKVLDFGLAKLVEQRGAAPGDTQATTFALGLTQPGAVIGTVAYMSPEQARGQEVDARTDIFSLGVVWHEMLTGSRTFAGGTASDMIAAILKSEPPPLSHFNQNIPAELERIVGKSLAKDREERYQTAKDLLVDLRRLLKKLETQDEVERTPAPNNTQHEHATQILTARPTRRSDEVAGAIRTYKLGFAIALGVLLVAGVVWGYRFIAGRSSQLRDIESIAVLPFINESGNSEVEHLSDGMTETLINSISQLPLLSVKARSSVFRYKGKEMKPETIASELSVQSLLTGRFVQRGNDLTLYLALVDGRNGNQLWGEQYHRKLADLVILQSEIARDVSQKLRARLSRADEQKVVRNYTDNAEAYQLYLKGRYHVFKITPPEVYKGIVYLQEAIRLDPNYALAYVGLSQAYRSLTLGGEMNPAETLPKAKAAAQKAIELDDALAEAHSTLAVTAFFYDWNWNEAENQNRRALELDPNSPITRVFYAHLLSNTGRHAEALAEIKRARELDPLSSFAGALEGQFLLHAGRTDEALDRLQKTADLDPNFYFPHIFAASAYNEKGMYREAIAEAHRAKALAPNETMSDVNEGYALAKSGQRVEARVVLERLLELSKVRFVPPYHIALIYNGLDERDKTFEWLDQGYQQRDPKMVFLKIDPKLNNLRSDPRFAELMRKVGLPQ